MGQTVYIKSLKLHPILMQYNYLNIRPIERNKNDLVKKSDQLLIKQKPEIACRCHNFGQHAPKSKPSLPINRCNSCSLTVNPGIYCFS